MTKVNIEYEDGSTRELFVNYNIEMAKELANSDWVMLLGDNFDTDIEWVHVEHLTQD